MKSPRPVSAVDPNSSVLSHAHNALQEQRSRPSNKGRNRLQNSISKYISNDRNRALRRIPQQEIALCGRYCLESDNETTPVDFIQPNNGGWKAIGGGLTSRW